MENRTPPESRQAQAAAPAPQAGEGRPQAEAAAPLRHRLACMLFVAGDPVPVSELARVLALPAKRVRELLREMEAECRAAGAGVAAIASSSAPSCRSTTNPSSGVGWQAASSAASATSSASNDFNT